MVDIVDPAMRSRMMAAIGTRDTEPELFVRKGLHRLGFRYRLNDRSLPGKPDLVFPKYQAVLFVHGCFWHRHDCHLFKWPGSREEFWRSKLDGNAQRDKRRYTELASGGWRVGIVWECAIKGRTRLSPEEVFTRCADWLTSDGKLLEIRGT